LHDYQPGSILRRAGKITHTDAQLTFSKHGPSSHISVEIPKEFIWRQIVLTSKAAKRHRRIAKLSMQQVSSSFSGTAPIEPETGKIKGTTIQEQTRQCLTNIAAILEAAGTSMEKIASATFILADEDDFAGMNEE
jgi:2-iminobutanoate/2-iminopropanoate deaminase